MSTTDSIRAAFESHWPNAAKERDGDTYDSTIWECRWEGWQAATEAAKTTGTAGEIDADAEMAKVKRDVELMGVGFLVDGKRCSLDRITWFNRPGDTWLPPPPGYPTEAARQPVPVVAVTRIDTGYGNYLEFERKTSGKSGWLVRNEKGELVRALTPTEVLLVDSALAATARSQP